MRRSLAWLLTAVMLFISTGAYAEETYSMAGYDGDSTNHVWETNLFFQRMEEKTGVSFTFDQHTEYAEWTKTKEAYISGAKEMPDVLFKAGLTGAETQEMLDKGLIIDLKPYLEQYAPNLWQLLKEHPEWEKAITLPGGEIAALPNINQLQNNNAMWINRTWLENLGLSVPTTAEELTEVLRAFKTRDPNRNGKNDEIPLAFLSMWDLKFLAHAYGIVQNDYNVCVDENGQVVTQLFSDENRAFLEWAHQLWEEGLIDHSGFSTADTLRAITDSKADITFGVMFAPTPLSLVPSSALGQYDLLMPLTWEGKQVYRDLGGDVIRGTFAIGSGCESPETPLSWVDYLYTEEGCRLAQAGLEGVEYEVNGDGTWNWMEDSETVARTVLATATIAEGGTVPGLSSVAFQRTYDDEETHRAVEALVKLKEVSVIPYPLVYLDKDDQARLDELQADAGRYVEQAMVWFVTGDTPLNDETWADFRQEATDRGMDEIIAILQGAIK